MDMNFVGKTFCAFILLTVALAMVTRGSQARNSTGADTKCCQGYNSSIDKKEDTQNLVQWTSLPNGNTNVHGIAGDSVNLICVTTSSLVDITSVIWKIIPKTGEPCTLAYRTDKNKTDRINCSERIDWKSSPDTDTALQIQNVILSDEGIYICEFVSAEGNFNQNYTLIVLVPPEMNLICDSNRDAVCKAAAGKPAAQIFWAPRGDSKNETENHPNGTVTVLSTYSFNKTGVTCTVSHPAWNMNQSKECKPEPSLPLHVWTIWLCAIAAGILGILFILTSIFLWKLHHGRLGYKSECPETAPTHNVQDSNEQHELEPYASYVQKENTIYSTMYEVVECEHPPPRLQSAT